MKIGLQIDHAKSLAAYQAAGHSFPCIPEGKNTIWHHFTLSDGRPAIIINQRGFAHCAQDNETPINGCSLAVALDAPDAATARATLQTWACEWLELK